MVSGGSYLYVQSNDAPEKVYKRGNDYLGEAAATATRLPAGHPEAFIEAFANIYKILGDTLRCKLLGIEPTEVMLDFPTVEDGAQGVNFIHKAVESDATEDKWTPIDFSL